MVNKKFVRDSAKPTANPQGFFELEALLGLLLLFCILGIVRESQQTMRSINELRRKEQCLRIIAAASYRASIAANLPKQVREYCDSDRIALSISCRDYIAAPKTVKCNAEFQANKHQDEKFAANLNRMSLRLRESYHWLPPLP